MPIDYRKYPADWPAIRRSILERAEYQCEQCGAPNLERGARDPAGKWYSLDDIDAIDGITDVFGCHPRIIRIVLTVAHLDHNVENNAPENLAALCQKCHLSHDAKHHAPNAAATRRRKRDAAGGQTTFLP